jgi:hypothetical protein
MMHAAAGRLKVVNLFGPPGVGKSSLRSGVFWLMKSLHMSVEEVSEYAKYLVLTERTWQLEREQLYLLAKQHHKQAILQGRYEYAVTDSPLLLCAFYANRDDDTNFVRLTRETFDQFDNINFYVTRDLTDGPFETQGRVHDREQARLVDERLRQCLHRWGVPYTEIPLTIDAPLRVLQSIAPDKAQLVREWVLLGGPQEATA